MNSLCGPCGWILALVGLISILIVCGLGFAPNFAKYPLQPNQYATEKGNTSLVCRPEAAPYPAFEDILWYKNGAALNPGTDEASRVRKMPNGNLFIINVQRGDAGTYKCQVTNVLGAAYTEGNLTVLSKWCIHVQVLVLHAGMNERLRDYITRKIKMTLDEGKGRDENDTECTKKQMKMKLNEWMKK